MMNVETALIGGLLTSTEAWYGMEVPVKPEMFEDSRLAWVYEALAGLMEEGKSVDWVLLEQRMRALDPGRFDEQKGLDFLLPALGEIRHAGNVALYAAEVERRYRLRVMKRILQEGVLKASDEEADPDKVLDAVEGQLADFMNEAVHEGEMQQIGQVASEALEWHRRRAEDGVKTEVLSGVDEFDFITGGFHNGEVTVLAGRPSEGKTAIALQMALNVARKGHPVCFFSLEMSSLQLINRVLAGMTRVDPERLRTILPSAADLEALEGAAVKLKDMPVFLDYTAGASLEQIRRKAFQRSRLGECGLVVVDYLHLIGGSREHQETQEQYIGRCIMGLKQLSLELKCPVVVLSQMNRLCETRPDRRHLPQMSDLRDSGTIEQVADCVTFVYRPDRHGITEDPETGESLRGVGQLLVLKNRNGDTGKACFCYNPSFTRVWNPSDIARRQGYQENRGYQESRGRHEQQGELAL